MEAEANRAKEGWTWLYNGTKDHYFVDGRSLCGRWMLMGSSDDLEPDDRKANRDRCKACQKAQERRRGAKRVSDGVNGIKPILDAALAEYMAERDDDPVPGLNVVYEEATPLTLEDWNRAKERLGDQKPGPDAPIEQVEAWELRQLWNDADDLEGEGEASTRGTRIMQLDPRLIQAQADAAQSVLLEVQAECVLWRKRAEFLKEHMEIAGWTLTWDDDPMVLFRLSRPALS